MAGKYLGLDRANQLAGAAVQLTRAVTNGLGTMPQGAEGIIDNKIGFVKDGKLRFKGKGCKTCGFQWSVANLNYTDLKLIDVSIGDIAEPPAKDPAAEIEALCNKLDAANELLYKIYESGCDLRELEKPVHDYLTK